MTNVILHGLLGKRFGTHHKFRVFKPVDAFRALMANKKGFRSAIKKWGRKGRLYEIICDGQVVENENDFVNPRNIKTIEIVPIIIGAGIGDWWKAVVGFILVVVGVIINVVSGGALSPIGNALIGMGIGLIAMNIMEILFPPQTPSFETEAAARSFTFATTSNTTSRGSSVQIGYGRYRMGSQVISTVLEPKRIGAEKVNQAISSQEGDNIITDYLQAVQRQQW